MIDMDFYINSQHYRSCSHINLSWVTYCEKMLHPPSQRIVDNEGDDLYLKNEIFKFEAGPHQSNLILHHVSQSFSCNGKNATRRHRYCRAGLAIKHFDFQKLAGLWLAGEVANHAEIYGSKAFDSFLAFQRRSFTSSHGIGQISSMGESGKSTHGNNHSHGCSQRWWLDMISI